MISFKLFILSNVFNLWSKFHKHWPVQCKQNMNDNNRFSHYNLHQGSTHGENKNIFHGYKTFW